MSTISRLPIKNLLSQLSKREQKDDQGGDHSNDRSPVVIVGLVIAALTLLLAIMSYRQSRFGRSQAASSLLPSHFVNVCPPPLFIVNCINILLVSQFIAPSSQDASPKLLNHHPVRRFYWTQSGLCLQ